MGDFKGRKDMNLWWKCPNCESKVDFTDEMSFVFDEEGEADFDPKSGLWFHTIMCDCGASWSVSIGKMEVMENGE
jgi:hypothetical protein